jgi:MerR family transcriptional regulator/heat shock protein HspR
MAQHQIFSQEYTQEPCFVISIASRMVGLHAQTLRYYERVGLIWPSRTSGRQRLYSPADIERLRRIKTLTEELGANLAGAEIALKLMGKIDELERETNQLRQELARLRSSLETKKTEARKT